MFAVLRLNPRSGVLQRNQHVVRLLNVGFYHNNRARCLTEAMASTAFCSGACLATDARRGA
jgi:hypothetical protein